MRGRGVSSLVGTLLLVAVSVVIASSLGMMVLNPGSTLPTEAPQVSVSHELVDDGNDQVVAVTFKAGDIVNINHLYVDGSKQLDIGGAPSSATPANEAFASEQEAFAEASGNNPPQVGTGVTWDPGETVYFDPVGEATDLTITIYWNENSIQDVNPGQVSGEDSYIVAEITIV